ncbi:YihY/virulence factor BrkB family protein [Mycetocola tolaasinivorans]|uniref:YihY/virulence factor BrkB family protein n=1 Tax=Mycetocola tolaasinivorans TaxID=76635 RepID=A0A3L7A6K0_9MICO|nr:YihY/virulence factor BrkB family protein [Mycetocola tolaasinivorans]RLP75939.1 YihY/virulence factor BrkB family protein [Mycetocola tolaasinivorans]
MSRRPRRAPRAKTAPRTPEDSLAESVRNSDNALVQRFEKPLERAGSAVDTVTRTRVVRSVMRFTDADGNLLSSGMSFQAVFAVFAGLYVGFAVAGIWLVANEQLFDNLVHIINNSVPGLIGTDSAKGIIAQKDILAIAGTNLFGLTGAIALFGLLFTAIAWLASTRQAVRAIFHLPRTKGNFVLQKVTDLGLALAFGVLLVLSAAANMVSTQAVSWLLSLIGVTANSFWGTASASAVGLVAGLLLNFITLAAMYRVLAKIPIPLPDLFMGSFFGASALTALSVAGGAVLGGASRNPLLATFAVFVALLIWFNFVCRVILIAGAWIAEGLERKGVVLLEQSEEERLAELAEARELVAWNAFDDAVAAAKRARGPAKIVARARAERARRELRDIRAEQRGH